MRRFPGSSIQRAHQEYGFAIWTKSIWLGIDTNYLFVYKLFEFAVEWIRAIRNKAEIVSIQKITCITELFIR